MKLLIVTQAVDLDNPILAFFHSWIKEFAKNCEKVTVICLEKGRYELPSNVNVISLGKEKTKRLAKLGYVRNFYKLIFKERKNYDAVFVHMNPIYVVLGGILWITWGKPVGTWYTHRQVDLKLRVATMLSKVIFTASKESFGINSKKVNVIGHGIDVERFSGIGRKKELGSQPIRLISVGRITPIKNCDILIEAARILKKEWNKTFEILLIGAPVTPEDFAYEHKIKNLIDAYELGDAVKLTGNIPSEELPLHYSMSDASVNLVPTGGVDKVVLESMAAGVPVFSSNITFQEYFGDFSNELIFRERDASDLAHKIISLFERGDIARIAGELQKTAREKASVSALIKKILGMLNDAKR